MTATARAAPSLPATERGDISRRHILEAAAKAFAEHGYIGTSLNDIIRDSGLTKGAFYFHFASKEALALEVFHTKQERWVGMTVAAMMSRSRAIDQLDAMLDVGCEAYETDPSARVVGRLCTELSRERGLGQKLRGHLDVWFDMTASLIRKAQEEGDVRADLDPKVAAETIVAAFIGVEQVSDVLSGCADLRRRVGGLRELLMGALRAPAMN